MKLSKQKLKQIIKEELSKVLSENERSPELHKWIGARFTKWFSGGRPGNNWTAQAVPGRGPTHRDDAPASAKALARDLRAGMFLDLVPEEEQEQYSELFNNLANALEQDPLLAHFRKLGKRGDWYAIATGNWDESMYNPPPYSHPDDRRDYGWEDISDPGWD